MNRALVFISHSAKDSELAPADAGDPVAAARWRRLRLARALRTAVFEALQALPFVHPWLDRRDLQAGDLWRDALHVELGRCDGAVLLLSPESLTSPWVLKEATILTWRQALGHPVRIVPVLLDVTDGDLERYGFGPLQLPEIQNLRVSVSDLDPDDEVGIGRVAAVVAGRFADLAAPARDTVVDKWADTLVLHWNNGAAEKIPAVYYREMMEVLGLSEARLPEGRFGELIPRPARDVAGELLLRTWREAVDTLELLAPLPINWPGVRSLVQPLWVPAAAAKVLPMAATREPGSRVILVTGTAPATGRAVVQRAYLGTVPGSRILAPDDSAVDEDQLVRRLLEQMKRLRVPEPGRVTARKPFFLVVGAAGATPEVIDRLRRTPGYDVVTYVVMVGPDRAVLLGMDPPPLCLDPDLLVTSESDGFDFAFALDSIAG